MLAISIHLLLTTPEVLLKYVAAADTGKKVKGENEAISKAMAIAQSNFPLLYAIPLFPFFIYFI